MNFSKPLLMLLIGGMMMLMGISYFISAAQHRVHLETLVIETKTGGKHTFKVEIADTPAKEETGLMFREKMAPERGMLFEMGRMGVVKFWMKNTALPLDMLFISADGKIKKVHENAVPQSLTVISSDVPVQAVLEINGGLVKALGISKGDMVVHPYFRRPLK